MSKLMRCDVAEEALLRLLEYMDDFGKSLIQQRTNYADVGITKLFFRDTSPDGGSGTIDIGDSLWQILFGSGDLASGALTMEEQQIIKAWTDATRLDYSDLSTVNHYLSPEFIESWRPPRIWSLQLLENECLPQDSKRVGRTCIKQHRVKGGKQ